MRRIFLFALAMWVTSCHNDPEGFTEVADGIYERLCAFGDGDLTLQQSYLSSLSVYTSQRLSSHFDYKSQIEIAPSDAFDAAPVFVIERLSNLREGDSLCWKLPYAALKGSFLDEYAIDGITVADTAQITLIVSVCAAYSKTSYFESDRYKQLQRSLQEEQRIEELIRSASLESEFETFGPIRFRILREGEGQVPVSGDEIVLGYEGYFLDSTQFDIAADTSSWLYFPYGRPDQVIKGIEMQLGYMREGEIREVFIPSALAFGERGSREIVPPHAPVRFILELVDVSLHEQK